MEITGVNAYLHRLGRDHCVYVGLSSSADPAGWQIWTSRPMAAAFRPPTAGEIERLRDYEPDCVVQGDLPDSERPACVRAELLAVSDLDGDGRLEFWHSAPYTWDTGLSVLEESQSDPERIVAACPGCSD